VKHHYKVTVEPRSDENTALPSGAALTFEVDNHDDILAIVKKLESRPDFTESDARAFGVGLKLFSEVMLKNKSLPLFSGFLPHFVDFMKELKKGIPGNGAQP